MDRSVGCVQMKERGVLNHTVKCMHANVRSILNEQKREELQVLVDEKKIDMFGITESWMHEGVEDAEVSMKGYSLFRRDRDKSCGEKNVEGEECCCI
jgi:hypothetical protein